MEAKAIAKYVRMSPIKLKPVADLVRGKDLNEASSRRLLYQRQRTQRTTLTWTATIYMLQRLRSIRVQQ